MIEYFPWIIIAVGIVALIVIGLVDRGALTSRAPDSPVLITPHGEPPPTFDEVVHPAPRNTRRPSGEPPEKRTNWMAVLVTFMVLCAALYVILSPDVYADASQKWAFGAVGTVVGFWFKH